MATFCCTARPRKKNSNEPLTYDISEPGAEPHLAGTVVKQKNKWRLRWKGIAADFDTRIQLQRHFAVLGHRIEGLA
ncbi:hypothetical protein [Methylorubrum populi]|uniref:hypothetical protein n=1 Tax=Methylorubrum populi TaxID=223967 RepID=UPI000DB59176|nr:hypothetical protein [Methylorubrum populi]PZP71797.1 MAG: hypothetical protein DI590_05920 [Methylorubrum populi]